MSSGRVAILFLCLVTFNLSLAQDVKVTGRFDADTVRLGQPIQFYLTARYSKNNQVLFPDSTFSFAPFEFQRKKFFSTKTVDNLSYDSVIYTVSTYEIDSIQLLALPVFQLQRKDCVAFYTEMDTVFFRQMVETVPDSLAISQLPLKTNTAYNPVSWLLNYPLLLIIVGVLIVTLVVLWVTFGDRIRRSFELKKLKKNHFAFLTTFEKSIQELQKRFSPESAEHAALIWKVYMEKLSDVPYTKYTTREIAGALPKGNVNSSLTSIDRMVYGGIRPDSLDSFEKLKSEAEETFRKRISQENITVATPRQYTIFEIENLANLLRELPCPSCHRTTEKLNGTTLYTVKSFIVLTFSGKKPAIACPTCLSKKNNIAIASTALLGWWGFPWGLIKTPNYIYQNIKAKKQHRNKQANEFLLSYAFGHADEIEANKDSKEKLEDMIKRKK